MILFVLVVCLYGVSVFGGFVQDDRRIILGDPTMGKIDGLVESWISPYYRKSPDSGAYRPLTSFSLAVDALVFGGKAWGFRLVNVLIFGLVVLGVYELGKRIFKEDILAFGLAVLFAVFPIHTEAVSNIVGRGELLAGGLVVMSLVLVLEKKWEMGMFLWFLALLSKESAMVWILPTVIAIGRSGERKDKKIGLMVIGGIVTVGYFLLRWGVLGNSIFADNATMVENPLKYVGTVQRMMAGIGLVAFGVVKTLFPIQLSYDYSFDQLKLSSLTTGWFGLGVFLILLSIWLWRNNIKALNWGLAFLWLPLMVTGNILKPIGTIFGERLWLLPSLGVGMVVVMIMDALMKKGKVCIDSCLRRNDKRDQGVTVLLGMILLMYAGRAFVRNLDWLSEDRLFRHDAEVVTGSVMAQNNAAAMYLMEKQPDRAKIYLDKAEMIYSKYPELMNNMGIYFWQKGDLENARMRFEECLKSYPGYQLCAGNLADLGAGVK